MEKRCFVCLKGEFEGYLNLTQNQLRAERCSHCGMVFVSNTPITKENISQFYTMDAYKGKRDLQDTSLYETYYENAFVGYDEQDITILQFKRILDDISRHFSLPQNNRPRLLDVGCASGVFLDIARKKGFDVKGVEISEDLADYARKEFHLDVSHDLIEAGYPTSSFDVVTLLDVIEHLPPSLLEKMIKEIHRVLQPGGILVLRTPGEDAMLRQIAKTLYFGSAKVVEGPMHLFYSYEHILSFSPATLKILFERNEFSHLESRREEENPDRLNMSKLMKFGLQFSYLFSGALGKEHKIIELFRKL